MECAVITPFVFYVDGNHPTQFEAGLQVLPSEVAAYALKKGFIDLDGDAQPAKQPRRKK